MSDEKKNEVKFVEVDDFIDYNFGEHQYARWVLNYFRMSAALKSDFAPFMEPHKLFCTWKGVRYRVTGASRMGDIWLAANFEQKRGYDHRVNLAEVTDWGPTPELETEKQPS